MNTTAKRVEIDTHPVPQMPTDVEKTEKVAEAAVKAQGADQNEAQFWSRYSDYKLGLDAEEIINVDNRWIVRPNSAHSIQFRDNTAIVKGEKTIQRLLRHKRFGVDFDIDTRDRTGYWIRKGFLRVKTQERETVERTDKMLLEE